MKNPPFLRAAQEIPGFRDCTGKPGLGHTVDDRNLALL